MKKIYWNIIKKYKILIVITVLFIILNIIVSTFPAKILGSIIDFMYDITSNKEQIIRYTIYMIITMVIIMLIRIVWRPLVSYLNKKIESDLISKVFEHLLKVKMSEIQQIKNGKLMSYFVEDILQIRKCFYRFISYLPRIVFTFIIVGMSMIKNVSLKLTIITLIPIAITTFLIVVIKKYVTRNYKRSQRYFTKLSEFVQESTDSIKTTKAYGQEYEQVKTFMNKNKKLRDSNNALDIYTTSLAILNNMCFGICYAIAILYGSNLVLNGEITIR